jgi:hypothetical protein
VVISFFRGEVGGPGYYSYPNVPIPPGQGIVRLLQAIKQRS